MVAEQRLTTPQQHCEAHRPLTRSYSRTQSPMVPAALLRTLRTRICTWRVVREVDQEALRAWLALAHAALLGQQTATCTAVAIATD